MQLVYEHWATLRSATSDVDCAMGVDGSVPSGCDDSGWNTHRGVGWSAMYNTFARMVWAVCLAVITYFCEAGYGGWINAFLSASGCVQITPAPRLRALPTCRSVTGH